MTPKKRPVKARRTAAPIQYDLFGNPLEPYVPPKQEVAVFRFEDSHEVRAVDVNGEPWFVAADLCRVLGLGNSAQAVASLRESEKSIIDRDRLGAMNNMVVINEPGLYRLMFKSRKPEAERFQDWVVTEVLPSIRKHGFYAFAQKTSRVDQWAKRLKTTDRVRAHERVESVDRNKEMHRRIIEDGGGPRECAATHNALYRGQYGLDRKQLGESLDIRRHDTPLNYASGLALRIRNQAIEITDRKIRDSGRSWTKQARAELLEQQTREIADETVKRLGPQYVFGMTKDAAGRPLMDLLRRQVAAS